MRNLLFILLFFFTSVKAENISILLGGDLMLGNNKQLMTDKLFGDSLNVIKNPYDVLFLNYESTIGKIGVDDKNPKCTTGKYCFTFMSDEKSLQLLDRIKNPSTNLVLNMANNHTRDYGDRIQEQTYNILKKYSAAIGYEKYPAQELNIKGNNIVFIGASPHSGSLSIFSPNLIRLVREYKKKNFIVIVSLHMGAEGNDKYWVKNQEENFAYQNRGNIYKLSHTLIDNGTDLIIGHGPHVIRGMEKYRNKLIIYSLGNFLTYGNFSLFDKTAQSTLIEVKLNSEGNLINGKIFGYQQLKSQNNSLWKKGVAIEKFQETTEWIKKLSNDNFSSTCHFDQDNNFF